MLKYVMNILLYQCDEFVHVQQHHSLENISVYICFKNMQGLECKTLNELPIH